MECNKDEAVRAKEMALKKMQSNDFVGARKMAMKAQLLFPDLENITQLLAVCNVHCSSQGRILGTEKDWYGILQLERKVDEVTIKKQYRKLALVLHPDKNQFPGAEAAFKLVGEAHLVLSDSSKKAVYDSKIGAFSKSAQLKHPPNIPPTWGKNGVHNRMANGYFNQFTAQHATQYNANGMQQRFWTYCPFCNINYQYHSDFVKVKVTCQNCKKAFIAFDTGGQPGRNMTHPVPQAVPVPPRSTYRSQTASQGVPSGFYNQPQASNVGKPYNLNQNQDVPHGFPVAAKANQPSVSQATYKTAEKTTGFQPPQSRCPSNLSGASSRDARPNVDAVHQKKPVEDRGKNKRKRKSALDAEPSESVDTASSSDLEEVIADIAAAQKFGSDRFYEPRRSSRQKQNVSYVEPQGDDDDFECPPQSSRVGKSIRGSEVQQEAADSLNKGSHASKGRSPEENAPSGKSEIGGRSTDELNGGAQGVETIHDSDSDSESCSDDAPSDTFECPDPEFHNFDKLREEACFSVDQFWACYDDSDGMPRFYAQVKEVWSNPFKVRVSWLEFIQDDDSLASDWYESGLPVGCGIYKRGTRSTLDPFTFSHPIECDKGKRKGSFMIYPRRGEIWALFRGWDTGWVNKSMRPKKYTYDIVEVLSDFTEDGGIQVTLLEKVKGFVSLFHRNNSDENISLPPNEMLRFSHMIPFFKMKGGEKEGVPAGSFELDTASVNLEHDTDPKDPSDSEMPKTTFKKIDELSSGTVSQISSSPSIQKKASGTNSKTSCSDFSPSKSEFISEAQSPRRSRRVNLASSPRSHGPQDLFCDFTSGRSIENFKVGQLWALYDSESKLPKIYGKIKKIQLSPSKLHVALLEACLRSENDSSSACGTFKVQKGTQNFEPTYFSHLLDVKPSKKDTFEVYPEKGQIWALHKNHNIQLLSSDPRNCDYDIVEIISKYKGFIKVLSLVKLKDFKSVFSSSDGTLEIQVKDVTRFSHQIPAVKLTNEGGRSWTGGCWELDPSVPLNK